ncbi:hypothetical protein M422DRAFT_193791, partial [Sphaerobolus stellatus SS14]
MHVGHHYTHPLEHAHPILVISMLGALLLNILGGLHRHYSNFVLRVYQMLLRLTFGSFPTKSGTELQAMLLQCHPIDIWTAAKMFNLEGDITIYAACPQCSFIYTSLYPERCNHNPFP